MKKKLIIRMSNNLETKCLCMLLHCFSRQMKEILIDNESSYVLKKFTHLV